MPRLLPFLNSTPSGSPCASGRSAMTCRMRCGDACAHDAPNTSDNEYFGEVAGDLSRRGLLRAGAVISVAGVAAGTAFGASPAAAAPGKGHGKPGGNKPSKPGKPGKPGTPGDLDFTPVEPNTLDQVVVPAGYAQAVVMAWGDPLFKGVPEFDVTKQSPAAQRKQFGFNNDFLGLLPLNGRQHLMVVNHEYTSEQMMHPGYDPANPTREQVEIGWAAHGLSVVVVEEERGTGNLRPVVGHRLNRRLHTGSRFELTGPVAGHELVRTKADRRGRTVLGTLNNCGGGLTPWGTWLTAEENFNQYFANGSSVSDATTLERLKRYGAANAATERKWENFDDRFDLAQEPNEINRFSTLR